MTTSIEQPLWAPSPERIAAANVTAFRLAAEGRWGHMVSFRPPRMTSVPFQAALERTKRVPHHHDALQTARDFGICLGEVSGSDTSGAPVSTRTSTS